MEAESLPDTSDEDVEMTPVDIGSININRKWVFTNQEFASFHK